MPVNPRNCLQQNVAAHYVYLVTAGSLPLLCPIPVFLDHLVYGIPFVYFDTVNLEKEVILVVLLAFV